MEAFLGGISKVSWEVDATATISSSVVVPSPEGGPPSSSSYLLWYMSGDLSSISLTLTLTISLSLYLSIYLVQSPLLLSANQAICNIQQESSLRQSVRQPDE
jgi:hypothetical protein